jgi:hypothetical protein
MRTMWIASSVLMGVALSALVVGCGPSSTTSAPSSGASSAASGSTAAEQSADADIQEALAQLPEADRELAVKQRICPVSGNPLGSMGKPVEVTVKGRRVFLCCDGCREEIEKEPDKYLAKIGQGEKRD